MAERKEYKIRISEEGARRVQSEMKGIERQSQSLRSGLLKIGLALGVAFSVREIIRFSKSLVDATSNLKEAVNAANVTFVQHSKIIKEFAKTSADAFGISARAALQNASTLGAIFTASGLAREEAAKMSVQMQKLAADIASVRNISLEESLLKIRSGLVGEAEPLRTVGILLSEAKIQQRAYAEGIARTGAVLTDAQKVQARYAEIIAQTMDIQGDFANTSDEIANASRRLQAQFEDLKAFLGLALIPTVSDVIAILNKLFETLGFNIEKLLVTPLERSLIIAQEELVKTEQEIKDIEQSLKDLEKVSTIGKIWKEAFRLDPTKSLKEGLEERKQVLQDDIKIWEENIKAIESVLNNQGKAFEKQAEQIRSVNIPALQELNVEIRNLSDIEMPEIEAIEVPETLSGNFAALADDPSWTILTNKANQFSSILSNAIVTQWQRGESALENFVEAFKSALAAMVAEILAKAAIFGLLQLITGGGFGVANQMGLGQFLFGGVRAAGGGKQHGVAVGPGLAFPVGEGGPEIFVPTQAGRIEPNRSTQNTFIIQALDPISFEQYLRTRGGAEAIVRTTGEVIQ